MRKILKGSFTPPPFPLAPCFPHLLIQKNLDLMAENHTLRGLLRSLSAFIGEGAGGVLPKLGWSLNDFENYINRAETDTAWESYQKRKGDTQNAQAEPSTSKQSTNPRKRPAEGGGSDRDKRQRSMTADVDSHSHDMPAIGNSLPADGTTLNDLLRTNASASPIYMTTTQSSAPQPTYPSSASGFTPSGSGSAPSFLHGLGLESSAKDHPDPVSLSLPAPRINQTTAAALETSEDDETYDPKIEEAGKLISYVMIAFAGHTQGLKLRPRYHLDNYKRVNTYCLPASLRPTLLQRFVRP